MPRIGAAADAAVLDDVVHHVPGKVARHGKPDPLIATRLAVDGGIDPDQLAARVDQRAAGVAWIDRGVGLDEVFVVGDSPFEAPVGGADDAERHGLIELEGIADRKHPFGDPQLRRVSPAENRQVGGVELEQGEVGERIRADDLGAELALVAEPDADVGAGAADDVIVGEDVAVGRHDDARAEALLTPLAIQVVLPEEVAEERVVGQRRAHDLGRRDVGDAADGALRDAGEVRQRGGDGRRRRRPRLRRSLRFGSRGRRGDLRAAHAAGEHEAGHQADGDRGEDDEEAPEHGHFPALVSGLRSCAAAEAAPSER